MSFAKAIGTDSSPPTTLNWISGRKRLMDGFRDKTRQFKFLSHTRVRQSLREADKSALN